jgi:hypothetical protein
MQAIDTENDHGLSYCDICGPGAVFRAIELGGGIFWFSLAWYGRQDKLFCIIFGVLGGLFALKGLLGLLFTRGVSIDGRRGRARVWRGFLVPLWGKTLRLERFDTVCISCKTVREGRTYTVMYPVHLAGRGQPEVLTVKRDYLEARRMGEEVAGYLGFDLLDETAAKPVLVPARHVGKSLREVVRATQAPPALRPSAPAVATAPARRTGGPLVVDPPPPSSRCACTVDGGRVVIDIPRQRFIGLMGAPVFAGLLVGGIGALIGFGLVGLACKKPGDWNEHLFPGLCITLGFGAFAFVLMFLVGVLPEAFVRYRVEAHPGGLRVRWRGLIFGGTKVMSSAELRELRPKGSVVEAIGTERIIDFGHSGLTGYEARWLRDTVTQALAG